MGNAEGRTVGPLPDGLHPWNISHIVPVCGRPGHTIPIEALHGPGLSGGRGGSKELTGYLCKARHFHLWILRRDLALAPDKLFSELKT